MAKPKTPNQKSLYKALNIRLNKYMVLVQAVFDALNQQTANIAGMTGFSGDGEFKFSDYPQVKEAVDRLRLDYVQSLRSIIYRGTSDEWKQSNLMQDLLADKAMNFYTSQAGKKKHKVYYQTNSDALKAFQQRRDKGLGLSQKLWDMSGNYKTEMEYAISTAIQRGTSAVQLSKQLSKYLNDFDSLKKDYKEKYGKAVDCHDCEYRSIRLARSEINMAYRSAEQARWMQMDFVLGKEIKLSKGHKERNYDICDELAGRYPKDFDWKGWHSNCYLPNAQVLTNHGWKYIKDVLSDDLVLSLNPQTRNVEYVGLTAKQAFEYEGEIVRFYNRSLDCAVTADHRMIFLGKGTKRIRYTQAKEFRKGNGAFYRGCNYDADDRMFIAINGDIFKFDLFCEFMAYWLSDGSLQHDNNISIAQQKGEPTYDSIIRCLSEMGYHIWFTKDSINFNDKNLNLYLRQFGLSNKKFIPKEILNASKRQIKIFLDAYVKCDGYTRQPHSFIGNHGNVFKSATTEKMYFTTSPQLCGDLCELILKAGYRPSIGVRPPTEHAVKKDGTIIKGNYDCYIIRICNALTATVFDKKIENYKGMVYDLTLEKNHIMYIQQNGRCYWGSNCTCYEIPILKTEEQFFADEDAPETEQTKPIQEFPEGFNNYIENNLGKIATANSKGTLGYFIRDNEDIKDCALLMNKARSVGDTVQSIAEGVAGAHGAVVTPINYKGFGSLYRKVHYGENGKPTPIAQIKDSVRNTIVLDGDLKKVIADLSKDSHWLRTKVQLPADFNGYSGNIVNLTMDNGVVAEIQVNTPKMIFAKESEKHARKILGDELYEQIAKETGMEGGVGHKLYEQIRVLDKVKDAEKIKELQAQSVEYYSHFQPKAANVAKVEYQPPHLQDILSEVKSDAIISQITGGRIKTFEEFFKQSGLTIEEAQKKLGKAIADTDVYMCIDGKTLLSKVIKGDGYFKSSIETGKGSFKIIGEERAVKERKMFGMADDCEKVEYPKYGFLASKGQMDYEDIIGFGYGDTYVRFKRSAVSGHSTFTIGDSYDGNQFIPKEVLAKEKHQLQDTIKFGFDPKQISEAKQRLKEIEELEKLSTAWRKVAPASPLNAPQVQSLLSMTRAGETYKDLGAIIEKGVGQMGWYRNTYVECQIYGKVGLNDVVSIEVSSIKQKEQLEKILKKKGLNIEVVPCKFNTKLKELENAFTDYDDKASQIIHSLTDKDIDNLGDFYIDGLMQRFGDKKNLWWKKIEMPNDFVSLQQKVFDGTATIEEKRTYCKMYLAEIRKKSAGAFPKVWWESYRPTQGGWTDDVLQKDLLRRKE